MPAVMLPLIWFLLPESLRSMAARNPEDPRIQPLADRMRAAGDAPVSVHAVARGKETRKRALLSDILGPGQLLKTLLMWAVAISSFVFIRGRVEDDDLQGCRRAELAAGRGDQRDQHGRRPRGHDADRLLHRSARLQAGDDLDLPPRGGGRGDDRRAGARRGMFVAVFAMAIFQHGGQAGIAAMAAALYPPSHRATGVGWAYGAGRIASIFAPLFGNFVLGEGFGAVGIFALLAVPLASAGIFSFWLMSLPGTPPSPCQPEALSHGRRRGSSGGRGPGRRRPCPCLQPCDAARGRCPCAARL
ncbi:MFS transporter [Sphingomonas sp. C8-2]|nr:MFS transporter [Sphingomonas sp. C8-2]